MVPSSDPGTAPTERNQTPASRRPSLRTECFSSFKASGADIAPCSLSPRLMSVSYKQPQWSSEGDPIGESRSQWRGGKSTARRTGHLCRAAESASDHQHMVQRVCSRSDPSAKSRKESREREDVAANLRWRQFLGRCWDIPLRRGRRMSPQRAIFLPLAAGKRRREKKSDVERVVLERRDSGDIALRRETRACTHRAASTSVSPERVTWLRKRRWCRVAEKRRKCPPAGAFSSQSVKGGKGKSAREEEAPKRVISI